MKKYLILFLLISAVGMAQNLNEYQYAMVPAKFSFLKEENQYNINLLCKMFMQKYGFETYYDNEVSNEEFAKTNCNKVFLDVTENNTMFTTKLTIVLKDCKGTVLATSGEGTSREKEYRIAYNEAIRMCFDSFNIVKTHKYQSSEKSRGIIGKPLVLLAKKTIDGFDLVYQNPENVYMNLKLTSLKDVYIASRKERTGIVFKENENWFFEYYINNEKFTEPLNVKF